MKNKFLNNQGMSIMEIMIAIGLAGGLTTIIMKNMDMQAKSMKTQTLNNNLNDIKRMFQDFVGRTDPCNASFAGKARGETIPQLRTKDDYSTDYFAVADGTTEFQKTGMAIEQMYLLTLPEEYEKFGTYVPLSTRDSEIGVGMAYLRVKMKKLVKAGRKQDFMGGATTFFDIPIFARFTGDAPWGAGTDHDQTRKSWYVEFNLEKTKRENQVNQQFDNYAASHPNHRDYTKVKTEIKLLSQNNYDGSTAAKTLPRCDIAPYSNSSPGEFCYDYDEDKSDTLTTGPYLFSGGTTWTLTWEIAHPLYPITDCGSHLSNGVK